VIYSRHRVELEWAWSSYYNSTIVRVRVKNTVDGSSMFLKLPIPTHHSEATLAAWISVRGVLADNVAIPFCYLRSFIRDVSPIPTRSQNGSTVLEWRSDEWGWAEMKPCR
jgi:hypothetical protein